MLDIALDSTKAGIIAGILAIIFVLIFWPRKGKHGINLRRTICPKCGHRLPMIRRPENERQRYYGGWTCKKCRAEIDKDGKLLTALSEQE
jgi:hypothetical protein